MELPVLIFLTYNCYYKVKRRQKTSTNDICYITEDYSNNLWVEDDSFRKALIFIALGFFITFMNKPMFIKLYRFLLTVLGFFYVLQGAIFSVEQILTEIIFKQPLHLCELRILTSWEDYLDQFLLEFGALIFNFLIMITLDADPWTEHKKDKKEKCCIRNIKNIFKFIFKIHLISVILCFSSIYTNNIVKIVFSFPEYLKPQVIVILGHKALTDRLTWIVTFLVASIIGLLTFHFYNKKNNVKNPSPTIKL